jgi:hypothetical protein
MSGAMQLTIGAYIGKLVPFRRISSAVVIDVVKAIKIRGVNFARFYAAVFGECLRIMQSGEMRLLPDYIIFTTHAQTRVTRLVEFSPDGRVFTLCEQCIGV